jgi:hypothetical protein
LITSAVMIRGYGYTMALGKVAKRISLAKRVALAYRFGYWNYLLEACVPPAC